MREQAFIELRGVTKSFGQGERAVHALQGIDLTVRRGELLAVRGRSGSGKTTLLHLVGALDDADAGTIRVGDQDVRALDEPGRLALRRDAVSYVFQSFGLVPELSAAENVSLPLRIARVAPTERDRRVAEILDRVGLGPHANQTPRQLSGGQQQRVSLARALVAEPSVLLADEPTGQLDSETAREIMGLVVSLVRDRAMTAVVTTHDPVIVGFADRSLQLVDGRLVDDQLVEDLPSA
ncbi:ABC transporter ATP-binding protein [Arsenicicoccus sp. oral taxon 190]|uniref:ABC transporter ATP-binding protein n=1 Tax=Arsenicicoccus sp. oral taxon 190 TaxID=1658671 RepID=UPI00067A019D|nr:ABC transporter ATP-binding protein [Arsenicicoccus sp. oral taxon 190]AKT51831.1 ABC transporter [Arsenicicoccus sp. oral taxon 190]